MFSYARLRNTWVSKPFSHLRTKILLHSKLSFKIIFYSILGRLCQCFFSFSEFQAMQQSGDTAFTFQTATAASEDEVSHIMVSTTTPITTTTTEVAEATLTADATIVEIPVVDKRTSILPWRSVKMFTTLKIGVILIQIGQL